MTDLAPGRAARATVARGPLPRTTVPVGRRTHGRWPVPWLLLLPGLALVLVFVLAPFVNTLRLSVTDSTLLVPGDFVGLANFERLAGDPRFRTAFLNSSLYVLVVVPVMVVAPLVVAALLSGPGRLMGFFRTSFYMPVVMSAVVVGLVWTNLLERQGLVNETLATLRLVTAPVPFLTDRWLVLFSAMFVTVWMGIGYYMVIYLAALANIDPSLYDAAAVDGAGVVRTFLAVTVPGVRSTMALVGVLSSVAAFRVFGEVYVLTGGTGGVGGGNITMTMLIQREGTGLQAQTGYAGTISLVMFCVLAALLVVQLVMQQRANR